MKNGTKAVFTAALILMATGLIFMLVSFAAGTRWEDLNSIHGKRYITRHFFNRFYGIDDIFCNIFNWNNRDENFDDFIDNFNDLQEEQNNLNDERNDWEDEAADLKSKWDTVSNNFFDDYTGQSIRSLDMEVNAAVIDIQKGESLTVKIRQNKHRGLYSVLKNGVLKINEKHTSAWCKNNKWHNNNAAYIIITLPEQTAFQNVRIVLNAGAAAVKHPSFFTEKLLIDVNAATVHIGSGVSASDSDAAPLSGVTSKDTEIQCNAGAVRIAGRLFGKTDVSCNAGKIALNIDSAGEEYSWNTLSALGSIHINDVRVKDSADSGYSKQSGSANSAQNRLKLSASVGSIDVVIR